MKKILLLSAAYLNGGGYVDAGNEVPIGKEKLEMTEERAEGMVTAKLAEMLPDDDDDGDQNGQPENLDSMKVEDLKALATNEGIELGQAKTKAEILAAIRSARG